jgi:hypothetical protein
MSGQPLSDYERGRQDERQAILRWMVLCLRGGEGINRADARVHELRRAITRGEHLRVFGPTEKTDEKQ